MHFKKFSSNLIKDIYKHNISTDFNHYQCHYLLEFIVNCSLDIGNYIYIRKVGYPIVEKSIGDKIYAFEDKSRGGYCYDEVFDNLKLTMFVPKDLVKVI